MTAAGLAGEDDRQCAQCGDRVSTLSSRDWCDGCEADAAGTGDDQARGGNEMSAFRALDIATGEVRAEFEVSYWVPSRYTVRLDAGEAAAALGELGFPVAAAVAAQIASGEIACGDAGEDEDGPLAELATAIAQMGGRFGADRPSGEPDNWDTPEDYHVWVGDDITTGDQT